MNGDDNDKVKAPGSEPSKQSLVISLKLTVDVEGLFHHRIDALHGSARTVARWPFCRT